MRLRTMLLNGVVAMSALTAAAQMGSMPAGPAVGSMESPAAAIQREVGLLEHDMVPLVKSMPADKFNFAPSQEIFASSQTTKYVTVRTFAQEVVHVAEANYYFYSSLSGLKPDVDMAAMRSMDKNPSIAKDEAVRMLEDSFAFAHKAVATITPENAFVAIKPVDGMNTRVTLATFGVAHGFDHFGQMVEYLRMNGMVPPGSQP